MTANLRFGIDGWEVVEILLEKPRNGNVDGRLRRKSARFSINMGIVYIQSYRIPVRFAFTSIADCESSSSRQTLQLFG